MPASLRSRIRALLPFVAQNASVADLAYVPKDAAANDGGPMPVQNRPWEWTEFLGERSFSDEKSVDDNNTIKNSSSLSLDLFGTRSAGRRLNPGNLEKLDHLLEGTLSRMQDTTYVESVFKRDWRESRLDQNLHLLGELQTTEQDDQLGPLPSFGSFAEQRSNSRMASPASSIRSRSSTQLVAGTSYRQSSQPPTRLPGSTASEAIDVDSLEFSTTTASFSQGNKRKASDEPEGDEDVQIVHGPVIASQKKQKGKPKKR